MQAAIDAGPFIHLGQIGEMGLLRELPQLYTPSSVLSEIKLGDDTLCPELSRWKNLKVVSVSVNSICEEARKISREFALYKGETDAIYIAQRFPSTTFLTDDLNARKAAQRLGIEVHGSIGIIAYAFQKGWISLAHAEQAIILLQEKSDLFVTQAIIQRAIRTLKVSI